MKSIRVERVSWASDHWEKNEEPASIRLTRLLGVELDIPQAVHVTW